MSKAAASDISWIEGEWPPQPPIFVVEARNSLPALHAVEDDRVGQKIWVLEVNGEAYPDWYVRQNERGRYIGVTPYGQKGSEYRDWAKSYVVGMLVRPVFTWQMYMRAQDEGTEAFFMRVNGEPVEVYLANEISEYGIRCQVLHYRNRRPYQYSDVREGMRAAEDMWVRQVAARKKTKET